MEYGAMKFPSYVDDITPYYGQSFHKIMEELEVDMSKTCTWFHHNGFKANPGKFNFILSPFVDRPIKILGSTIKASKEDVLLGVKIDSDLTFKEHATSFCSKANQKSHA